MIAFLFRPRPLGMLLGISLLLGLVLMARSVPLALVLGTAPYWEFPQLYGPLGSNDVADVLLGHVYFINAPWGWPLLHIPRLGAPAGTNLYWLDAIPWLAVLGKGLGANLLGPYWVLCLVAPGMAMTWLLAAAGQRNLAVAAAGTVLADSTLPLLGRGGGLALSAQFLLVVALALYVAGSGAGLGAGPGAGPDAGPDAGDRAGRRVAAAWVGLLALGAATNVYLFAMVGGIWAAACLRRLGERRVPGSSRVRALAAEAAAAAGAVLAVLYLAGMLDGTLGRAGGPGFGFLSMNLLAPVAPQGSGLVPGFREYRLGHSGQFADTNVYLGGGVLLLLGAAAVACRRGAGRDWARGAWRRHLWLLLVLAGFTGFALSHQVYLGSRLLLAVPLPEAAVQALGVLRTSIRFFWAVGFALVALGVVAVARFAGGREDRKGPALAVLALACATQLADVEPTRARMAANLAGPAPAAVDRAAVRAELAGARQVLVYPSWGCVLPLVEAGRIPVAERDWRLQQNVEIQLLAARANLPVNSVYNARLRPDCAAEAAAMARTPPDGAVTFLLQGFSPPAGAACRAVGDVTVCRAG